MIFQALLLIGMLLAGVQSDDLTPDLQELQQNYVSNTFLL